MAKIRVADFKMLHVLVLKDTVVDLAVGFVPLVAVVLLDGSDELDGHEPTEPARRRHAAALLDEVLGVLVVGVELGRHPYLQVQQGVRRVGTEEGIRINYPHILAGHLNVPFLLVDEAVHDVGEIEVVLVLLQRDVLVSDHFLQVDLEDVRDELVRHSVGHVDCDRTHRSRVVDIFFAWL